MSQPQFKKSHPAVAIADACCDCGIVHAKVVAALSAGSHKTIKSVHTSCRKYETTSMSCAVVQQVYTNLEVVCVSADQTIKLITCLQFMPQLYHGNCGIRSANCTVMLSVRVFSKLHIDSRACK